jgi:cytochrome bd-type quinol oxidase subunit 2
MIAPSFENSEIDNINQNFYKMESKKSFLIWMCFVASNILAIPGFSLTIHHKNKMLSQPFLIISLLLILGFWIISAYEISRSSKLTKRQKFIWPIIVIVLSTFGQIWYLVKRKEIIN